MPQRLVGVPTFGRPHWRNCVGGILNTPGAEVTRLAELNQLALVGQLRGNEFFNVDE